MDMAFARRQRPVSIDLAVLLARTSAVQASSPTAQAHLRGIGASPPHSDVCVRVALFEGVPADAPVEGAPASFATLDPLIFSRRQ